MLAGARCSSCGHISVPPRDSCPACGSQGLEATTIAGGARVYAATWIPGAFALEGFGGEGYAVAWVDLDQGPRIQVLVEGGAPAPDTPGTVDAIALEPYSIPVFRPAAS